MSKTKIIAEIGINHNGDIDLAKKLILEAKKCGVDMLNSKLIKLKILLRIMLKKLNIKK